MVRETSLSVSSSLRNITSKQILLVETQFNLMRHALRGMQPVSTNSWEQLNTQTLQVIPPSTVVQGSVTTGALDLALALEISSHSYEELCCTRLNRFTES